MADNAPHSCPRRPSKATGLMHLFTWTLSITALLVALGGWQGWPKRLPVSTVPEDEPITYIDESEIDHNESRQELGRYHKGIVIDGERLVWSSLYDDYIYVDCVELKADWLELCNKLTGKPERILLYPRRDGQVFFGGRWHNDPDGRLGHYDPPTVPATFLEQYPHLPEPKSPTY